MKGGIPFHHVYSLESCDTRVMFNKKKIKKDEDIRMMMYYSCHPVVLPYIMLCNHNNYNGFGDIILLFRLHSCCTRRRSFANSTNC